MASLADISQKLLPNHFFHLFNRGINGQKIFVTEENYNYFLKKYAAKTKAYLDTYAYCLLPNHFHFLVKIKSVDEVLLAGKEEYLMIPKALQKELVTNGLKVLSDMPNLKDLAYLNPANQTYINPILGFLEKQPFSYLTEQPHQRIKTITASWLVSNQLRKLFLGYAKAINKQEGRNGSLMQKPFRRKWVDNESYVKWLVWYLHRNPLHHELTIDFQNYRYSSYQGHFSEKSTLLKRAEVMDLFDGQVNFYQLHIEAAKEWAEWQKFVME